MRILYFLRTVVSVGCLFMLFPAGAINAQNRVLAGVAGPSAQAGHTNAAPALTGQTLQRVAQIYAPREGIRVSPCAVRNDDMRSPKSVTFNAEGTRIYVNALEGYSTLVYSFPELKFIAKISHTFTEAENDLFGGEQSIFDYVYHEKAPSGNPNIFSGKPVEAALSHEGKYLWVPYYRRDFDKNASCPSAVAIIDVASNSMVRVMPTGTLPKVVAVSPDDKLVAISHWGDNTVGLIDISSEDPQKFVYTSHLVVGRRVDTSRVRGNRDNNCGNCLRGTVFSPDSKYLFVGRMGGGGITCFSMPEGKLMGSFAAFCATPRHLDIDPSGNWLYAGSNRTGFISRVRLQDVITALGSAEGRAINGPEGEKLYVGIGLRTIAISQDGKYLYAAVNGESQLAQVDIASWRVVRKVAVSPFSVGLAVSPDGTHVVVTSQGKGEQGGGNSIEVFRTTMR